ncbi:hypothetical protein K493DRAFT_340949 [Basidiobolus meristosporus CBS 931.73]|uniref:G domain-containing protein n=1 Tax=Basidiobolus meristosporus CBS 931.73 TaxID=1314790 RepID=A0A1Y1XU01_9FUNG|nr:hypothetical protein K493DRAFT_340949 [Basidiobolus meristosporus CBS 931.73]|eukprot:ORX88966.1 hypothetical protein K493DRAFT_340949 [Basidiobolus meristosporus CBS 931.73]
MSAAVVHQLRYLRKLPLLPSKANCLVPLKETLRRPGAYYALSRFATSAEKLPPNNETVQQRLSKTLGDINQLQLKLEEQSSSWIKRTATAIPELDAIFRVAVIGEARTGGESLINALLDNPFGEKEASDAIALRTTALKTGKVHRICFGQTPTTVDVGDCVNVNVPTDWLRAQHTELYELPALGRVDESVVDDVIQRSDLVLFMTDTVRRFEGAAEQRFFRKVFNKKNVLFLINEVEAVGNEANRAESIIEEIQAEMKTVVSDSAEDGQLPQIFYLSTRDALAAQEAMKATEVNEYQKLWIRSGIQQVKDIVCKTLTPQQIQSMKYESMGFVGLKALERLTRQQKRILTTLERTGLEIGKLSERVQAGRKNMADHFVHKEILIVDRNIMDVKSRIQNYFSRVKFYQAFFKFGSVDIDLRNAYGGGILEEAEHRMTYATGRFNEALESVRLDLTRGLDQLATELPHQENMIGRELKADLEGLQSKLENVDFIKESDPFVLSNIVWRQRHSFDIESQCQEIHQKASNLVAQSAGLQITALGIGLSMYSLHLPLTFTLPSYLVAAATGFGYMNLRWEYFEKKLLKTLTKFEEKLKSDLITVYERELDEKLSQPSLNALEEARHAIDRGTHRVQENEDDIRQTQEELAGIFSSISAHPQDTPTNN